MRLEQFGGNLLPMGNELSVFQWALDDHGIEVTGNHLEALHRDVQLTRGACALKEEVYLVYLDKQHF